MSRMSGQRPQKETETMTTNNDSDPITIETDNGLTIEWDGTSGPESWSIFAADGYLVDCASTEHEARELAKGWWESEK